MKLVHDGPYLNIFCRFLEEKHGDEKGIYVRTTYVKFLKIPYFVKSFSLLFSRYKSYTRKIVCMITFFLICDFIFINKYYKSFLKLENASRENVRNKIIETDTYYQN